MWKARLSLIKDTRQTMCFKVVREQGIDMQLEQLCNECKFTLKFGKYTCPLRKCLILPPFGFIMDGAQPC